MATVSPSTTPVTDAGKTRVLARFTAAGNVSTDQYDKAMDRMAASGNWPPDGLEYHVAFRSNGNLRVSEVWDSREQLDASVARLMPVLKDVGIELRSEPELLDVHNVISR
jgi:hypothetical protein